MDDPSRPIFLQLSERLEDEIISGLIEEESPIPSINELAAFHRINPATALKAVNLLVEQGTLYKKRGIGMFVVAGARKQLAGEYLTKFQSDFVGPLVDQAKKLGISNAAIIQMIEKGNQ
jgi:GntR family transcriptional regulator